MHVLKEATDLFCTQLTAVETVVREDKCHVHMFII